MEKVEEIRKGNKVLRIFRDEEIYDLRGDDSDNVIIDYEGMQEEFNDKLDRLLREVNPEVLNG